MFFDNTEDYLCYIEAVHLLIHENVKKVCDFLQDNSYFMSGQTTKNYAYTSFLNDIDRNNERFFIIDNTDYPEALTDPKWNWDKKSSDVDLMHQDHSKDVYVLVTFTTAFTSN